MYKHTKKVWKKWWVQYPDYGERNNEEKYLLRSEYMAEECKRQGLKFSSLCELGIGSGRNVAAFHRLGPDAKYAGNDIYPEIEKVIQDQHPAILKYTDLYIQDTLSFLKDCPCEMEFIFTHGHLMHIPEDVIAKVMELIFKKADMVAFCEAYPMDKSKEEYDKYKAGYRFQRDYEQFFPEGFEMLLKKPLDHKSHFYIGKRV